MSNNYANYYYHSNYGNLNEMGKSWKDILTEFTQKIQQN